VAFPVSSSSHLGILNDAGSSNSSAFQAAVIGRIYVIVALLLFSLRSFLIFRGYCRRSFSQSPSASIALPQ